MKRWLSGILSRRRLPAIPPAQGPRQRILFVANAMIPTLQLSFLAPLRGLEASGEVQLHVLTDEALKQAGADEAASKRYAERTLARFRPSVVVFCRYSGPLAEHILQCAGRRSIATVLHLDDDLLNVPRELGEQKHAFHSAPERRRSLEVLLRHADLLYCATPALWRRMAPHRYERPVVVGDIYCASEVLRDPPPPAAAPVIGYMGIDHAHDFEIARNGLAAVLEQRPDVRFEIFGPILVPPALQRFSERIARVDMVRDYDQFKRTLAARSWTVGIAPLAYSAFNEVKANTKWVEYAACGIATAATGGTVYDDCCADECGLLVESSTPAWFAALMSLLEEPRRLTVASKAQARLRERYSPQRLTEQVVGVLEQARRAYTRQT